MNEHGRVAPRDIFLRAVALAAHERDAFLDDACAGNASLRYEIEQLIAYDTDDDRFLETPAAASGIHAPGEPIIPTTVGGFTVIDRLGEGGTGIVLLAEQDDPSRRVALKVLRTGAWSAPLLSRFRFESEVLARLTHPGIASVYASGIDDSGNAPMPYIAMELVEGTRLTEFAAERRLTTRERVDLLRQVCEAVAHAHARGVIHRDLKPSNILVNADGDPKVLDFGVAREIDSGDPGEAKSQATMTGHIIGTLAYMSPEQLAGKPDAIDTRTDVYALGVILYELLTGSLPHRHTTIAQAAASLPTAPVPRLASHDRTLRGDIDAIARKTLDPDPARRYTGAAELAADLERYLQREPVSAQTPTVGYLIKSFAARNQALVSAAGLGLLLLVSSLAIAINGLVRAKHAAAESDAAVETVQAVNDFLVGMLEQAHPDVAKGREITASEMVDTAVRRMRESPAPDPRTDAALRVTIGETLAALGRYEESTEFLASARKSLAEQGLAGSPVASAAAAAHAGVLIEIGEFSGSSDAISEISPQNRDDPEAAIVANRLRATLLLRSGETEAAITQYRDALNDGISTLGPDHTQTIKTRLALASVLYENAAINEAAELMTSAVEHLSRTEGPDHPATLAAEHTLASTRHVQGKTDEAVELYRSVIRGRSRVLGKEHPRTLESQNNLAILLRSLGQTEEAIELHTTVLDVQRRVLPENHIETLSSMNNLALLYQDLKQFDEVERLQRAAASGLMKTLGQVHPFTLAMRNNVGMTLRRSGRTEEAIDHFTSLMKDATGVLGDSSTTTHSIIHNLGGALHEAGDHESAHAMFIRVVELAEKEGDGYPPASRGIYLRSLGICQAAVGEREAAMETLQRAHDILSNALGETNQATAVARDHLEKLRAGSPP